MKTKYLTHWEENIGKCHYDIRVEKVSQDWGRKSIKDKNDKYDFLKVYISEPTRKPSAKLKSSHKVEAGCGTEEGVRSNAAYQWKWVF